MRCGKAQKMISAHLDEELDGSREKRVRKHLLGCKRCRAFAADVARFTKDFDLLTVPEPRWGFTERLMARLSDQESKVAGSGSWLDLLRPAPLGLGTAAFCLGVAATFLLNGVNGEMNGNGTAQDAVIEAVAGDYATMYAEASVQQQLWALLPETED